MQREFNVFVKNISASTYTIDELNGYELESDTEINMLDEEMENHYTDARAVLRAINDLPDTTLYIGVHGDPQKLEYRVEPKVQQ